MKRIICTMLVGVLLSGCTTMNPVPLGGGDWTAGVKVGDTIATKGRDGRPSQFEVTRVSPEEICGADQCMRKTDIVGLEVQEISGWQTVLLVGGVVLLVAAVVAAGQGAAASSLLRAVPK